jgi:hypothetical protein
VIQLRQADFSYNGKDVTIWTVVEIAVAIIGASIPVLRVFFREKVSSYSHSHGRSVAPSTLKRVPTTTARRSIALTAMAPSKDKEGVWTRIEPIDGRSGHVDSHSERSSTRRRSDEESGGGFRSPGTGSQDGIWQTTSITHEVEERGDQLDRRRTSWLA